MGRRSQRVGTKNRTVALIVTLLLHAVIISALFIKLNSKPEHTEAAFAEKVDVVKATTVDATSIEKEKEKLRKKDLEKKRQEELERKRLEELKKKADLEKKRIEELKQKQKEEKNKAEELEKQRKAIALKKKKEEEKRKKEEQARKKKEAEKKRKQEAARKKREAEEAERQRRLAESLAAEEAFQAEQRAQQRATTLMGKYAALITQKVSRYWAISPDYVPGLQTYVNVKLSPYGDVRSVRILKSSGNTRFDRSVESAILKATPLPIPTANEDPDVNKIFQDINLTFDPEDLR